MNKLEIITQIVTTEIESFDDLFKKEILIGKLNEAKKYVNLGALMIWADTSEKTFQMIVDICNDLNIEIYLWYPILGTIPEYSLKKYEKVESFNRTRGYGKIAHWDKINTYPEDFSFACPNNEKLIDKVFNDFKIKFNKYNFDGVFLDRIRFPAPSNGFEMLFTCFCDFCKDRFLKENSDNLETYRNLVKLYYKNLQNLNYNDLIKIKSFKDLLFPPEITKFYNFRTQSIYRVIKKFSKYVKEKNKKVGLDVFSPSLADIVSQDFSILSDLCHWFKPMIYCHSKEPAGIPLEIYSLLKALMHLNSNLNENELLNIFEKILDTKLPDKIDDILKKGIPESFLTTELNKIKKLRLPRNIDYYPGFEVVQKTSNCIIDEKILENYLKEITNMYIKGITLSWNIIEIPKNNFRFIGDFLNISG